MHLNLFHSHKITTVMDYDNEYDAFKKPGAVPFKWEIKPGVPIIHHHNHQKLRVQSEPPSPKLRPPPASSYLFSPVESRTWSFRSDRFRFDRPLISRPESVSTDCFFSPFLRRLMRKKMVPEQVTEPDYALELETVSRWSFSARKSFSPFRPSTTSSPLPVSDVEWAGIGLF